MARAHVARFGVAGMTIDDMASELGVSKGSFYAHFTNRDDLLAATVDEILVHERARTRKYLSDVNGDAGVRLRDCLNEAAADTERSQVVAQLMSDRTSQLVATAAAELADLNLQTFQHLLEATGLEPGTASSRATVLHAALTGFWLTAVLDSTAEASDLANLLHASATTVTTQRGAARLLGPSADGGALP